MTCNNSDDDSSDTNDTPSEVISTVQNGSWRITSFIDSGRDETHHFTGYQFTFGSNDVLTATNGSITYTGTWRVTSSSSSSSSSNDLDFDIFFNLNNDFEDLSDDWDIVSRSATRLELVDVSGGNGGTDYLTFERN